MNLTGRRITLLAVAGLALWLLTAITNVGLIAIDDYRALEETAYLLRSPANVRRLVESLDQARSGSAREHDLDR